MGLSLVDQLRRPLAYPDSRVYPLCMASSTAPLPFTTPSTGEFVLMVAMGKKGREARFRAPKKDTLTRTVVEAGDLADHVMPFKVIGVRLA
jgi:hypothetical protein